MNEMESSEIKSYIMNSLCRICAEKSSKLTPIFDIQLLPSKINKCLPINVTITDHLPNNICEMCLLKIDESYLLYEMCYFADERLKNLWKTLSKEETDLEVVLNPTSDSEVNILSLGNYTNECIVNNNKKESVGMLLIGSNVVEFDQNLGFQEHDVIPSDMIIHVTDEADYNSLKDDGSINNNIGYTENVIHLCKDVSKMSDGAYETKIVIHHAESEVPVECKQVEDVHEKTGVILDSLLIENDKRVKNLSDSNEENGIHSEKLFLCDTCGKSFRHANNLKSHAKIHSAHRKKYTCKICFKTFFTNFFLQEHMNKHTGETPYKCQTCGKEFREKVHLRQHKWTHSSKKFLCPVCGNHFNRKGNMTEHIKKYHTSCEKEKAITSKKESTTASDALFSCSLCDKSFTSQVQLKNHHKRHLNKQTQQTHICSLCGKQFRHSGSLTYHRRTAHTGEKPFKCSYCEERFSLRSVQRIHERKKHTFEYPYKCSYCSRMFNNSSSLKNHSYVHMKEKMFECDECGKKFSRSSNLFVHKKIHSDDRQYSCEHCGKSYIQKHDMIKHKKIHSPKYKPFFCKYCGNSFAHKKDFAKHAVCHFNYIRKSNSDGNSAEKILETVTDDLQEHSNNLLEAEHLLLEASQELPQEKSDVT